MKKMTVILMMAMAMVIGYFSVAVAQEQRLNFYLQSNQEVQKFINFRFEVPSWGCATYVFEPGRPFFDKKGYWKELSPGQVTQYSSGFYRFIADENGCEVSIIGEVIEWTNYRDDQGFTIDYQDISLFMKDIWIPFDIGLLPRNGADGSYQYSYSWLCPGWGTSVCLEVADKYTDFSGEYVGVVIFNSAGFPRKVVRSKAKRLYDEWVNPGEIALLIHYQGNNWRAEKKKFFEAIKEANENIREISD